MRPSTETTPVASAARGHRPGEGSRVGPNAIIQTRTALDDLVGPALGCAVFEDAGLGCYLAAAPAEMVDEAEPAALFAALRHRMPPNAADRVLREAGLRTGDYILAHRIPRPVQVLLRRLPDMLASWLLLSAIREHAWTFAGSGEFICSHGRPLVIEIADNPLATPGCPWHLAVFERLFHSLVDARVTVEHSTCCAAGEAVCRTTIRRGGGRLVH
jgi:divinyl protochlorophyllide a 8-vinyl-reductase